MLGDWSQKCWGTGARNAGGLEPEMHVSFGDSMCLPEKECVFGKQKVSSEHRMCLRGTDYVSAGDRMCRPETACVFQRKNVCVSETHTECVRVINWAPDGLWTWFPHQIELKRCDQFTDPINIVQNGSKIMKITSPKIFFQNLCYFVQFFKILFRFKIQNNT